MKTLSLIFLLCQFSSLGFCKGSPRGDFYDSIRYFDLSELWCADSTLDLEAAATGKKPVFYPFTEPLGYIGSNYQRLYVHFISVTKSRVNPYLYNVHGKTRVRNNTCSFTGTITVDTASRNYDSPSDGFGGGWVVCHCVFREDGNNEFAGKITGTMSTGWCIVDGKICYDNRYLVADGYSNNQFEGKWKSYKTGVVKKCNWGDFRIPDSGELDEGAAEFCPAQRYIKNGWQTYYDATNGMSSERMIKAQAEENKKWWK